MTKKIIDVSKITIEQFNKIIDDNLETILKSTPHNPTVATDDEWNDPEYDKFTDEIMKRLNNEIEEK